MKMKIVTIIPVYNEERSIKNVIKRAIKYSDVIVVDDGSTDNTFDIAREYATVTIKHHKNQGKGAAIKTGLKKALDSKYEVFILMDGDGQHNPDFIPDLASKLDNLDMIIGSRFIEEEPADMPLQRRISNKLTTKLIKYATGYNITDSQSGFRALSPKAAQVFIDIPYNDYVYESEMFYTALKHEMLIDEQKISCDYKNEESYITIVNIFRYLLFILELFLRNCWCNLHHFRFKSYIKWISKEE